MCGGSCTTSGGLANELVADELFIGLFRLDSVQPTASSAFRCQYYARSITNLQPGSTCIEILCDFALFSQNMRAALVLGFSVLPRDVAVIHAPGIPREDNHREFQY